MCRIDPSEAEHLTASFLRQARGEEPEPKSNGKADHSKTEDALAIAFAERHCDKLRYCHHTGAWFIWTGTQWRREETKLAFCWARDACRDLGGNKMARANVASAVERFAQADRAFAVTSEVWDRDKFLLGTPGGTVDLRTGKLRPAKQAEYITRSTEVAPAETPDCPLWLQFLGQVTAHDQDLIAFLQRWFGYGLTGDTREHALAFFYGPGGNGKGTMLNAMSGVMGTYATVAAMDTFTASKHERHPTDLAMLRGARLVIATETEEGRAWAEARIKALTGGDPITARFMRQDFFTFMPDFKLSISGNHKPMLRNVDDAARRRFNVVPCNFKPAEPDKHLEAKLREEWPGILRWMIDGCLAWEAKGLGQPKVVRQATDEYFAEQDLIAQWLEEHCECKAGVGSSLPTLFASWKHFAIGVGAEPHSSQWLGNRLCRQFARGKDCAGLFRGRGFVGIRALPTLSDDDLEVRAAR
jgi:P4 family phage/plasmid primase-like protien